MRLPVYAAVASLAISLLVVGGVFVIRPKKAAPPKRASSKPLYVEGVLNPQLSKSAVEIHQNLLDRAEKGDIVGVRKCLEAGADVNVCEDADVCSTPLTYAAQNSEVEMTRFLLEHGADPNKGYRIPPLSMAISDNESPRSVECARLLLKGGADPWRKDFDNSRPIDYANKAGNVSMVRLLIEWMPKLDADHRRKYMQGTRNIALRNAMASGTLNQVRQLVADGADVNDMNEFVASPAMTVVDAPLMTAVARGSIPMVKFLLEKGAQVDLKNDSERTALMFTGDPEPYLYEELEHPVRETNGDIARILLQHGARVDLHDSSPKTALMYAARGGSKACEVLLAHRAKINEQGEYGYTALHYAAEVRDDESVRVLLWHGASVNIQNASGVTALMLASVNPDYPSTAKERIKRLNCMKLLRQFGANEGLKDDEGRTAKWYATQRDLDFIEPH